MPAHDLRQDDPLDDFTCRVMAFDDVERRVHVAGTGPAVIVLAEMPGISPQVARFARWVRDAGMTVYMPSLFGRDGAAASKRAISRSSIMRGRSAVRRPTTPI